MSNLTRIRREKLLAAAEGYLDLNMPEHALSALDAIEEPERSPFAVNFQRGMVLRHLERHDEALEAFEKAYDEDAENVELLMAMAWCCKRTDQLRRAISLMEQAYRAAPKEAIILYNLACYWSLARNKTQALQWLGRALRMNRALRSLIPGESDFDALRGDPDFNKLVRLPDEALKGMKTEG